MSNIYLEAANDVEREATRAESMAKVAADLRAVGGLQQVANEAKSRLDGLNDEIVRAASSLEKARVEAREVVAAAQREADDIKAVAKASAIARLAEVDAEKATIAGIAASADAKVRDAEKRAADILAKAGADAEGIIAAARDKAAEYEPTLVALEARKAEIDAAKLKLAEITAQIDALRAKF